MRSHLAGAVVLVLEQDADTRRELTHALAKAGARVRTTSGATDALSVLLVEKIDVLVCGLDLGDRTGYDVVRTVRSLRDEKKRDMPLIGVGDPSAWRPIRPSARAESFDDYLPTPVSGPRVVHRVTRAYTGMPTGLTGRLPRIA